MLEEKPRGLERRCAEYKGAAAVASAPVLIKQERKMKNFSEHDDIDDWIDNIKSHLNGLTSEREKVDFIFSHLNKRPCTELRVQVDRGKATTKQVFDILRKTYAVKESNIELQVWFVGVERLFVTVLDISRPCQPEKLIPLLPWPGFDPSFSGHNDRRAIISEWTRLRLRPLIHRGWLLNSRKTST